MQTRQVDPTAAGNDDWKAGTYSTDGVPTLLDRVATAREVRAQYDRFLAG
jgi:hypothetical protein